MRALVARGGGWRCQLIMSGGEGGVSVVASCGVYLWVITRSVCVFNTVLNELSENH